MHIRNVRKENFVQAFCAGLIMVEDLKYGMKEARFVGFVIGATKNVS